jgi:hypothetical protein
MCHFNVQHMNCFHAQQRNLTNNTLLVTSTNLIYSPSIISVNSKYEPVKTNLNIRVLETYILLGFKQKILYLISMATELSTSLQNISSATYSLNCSSSVGLIIRQQQVESYISTENV